MNSHFPKPVQHLRVGVSVGVPLAAADDHILGIDSLQKVLRVGGTAAVVGCLIDVGFQALSAGYHILFGMLLGIPGK